ncbi:MAG TPA: DUF5597 domain-containing protein [Opitutaceae bacterium]|nr:DUF5597 domain-containing protein [Opitutaceae bacterium]
MKSPLRLSPLSVSLTLFALAAPLVLGAADIPRLQRNGAATQLMVDGKPYLALAGELHNSSASSRQYMASIWPKLKQMNLNTVLATVQWDMIEPAEGKFDFSSVDGLIEDARKNNLKLALLWFGSWKNGLSHYTPEWVKADRKRFPYALTRHGTVEILSVFSEEARAADARAFAALMRHIKEVDTARTVLMVQVENEVGLHADARDRSAIADTAFAQAVPADVLKNLSERRDTLGTSLHGVWQRAGFKTSGTWADVFGTSPAAEEAFQAWGYARYVDSVAAAGKAEYPLPMFVNAWIVQPQDELPGDYPSGGPQAHSLDMWRATARHIDIFAPDIYLPNFTEVCSQFARAGDAFFVPESKAGVEGVANAFTAIGHFNSIGYSPFGIETREANPGTGPISHAYALLAQLAPQILEHQAKGDIAAVTLTRQNPTQLIELGDYILKAAMVADRRGAGPSPETGYMMAMQTGKDEFVVSGGDLQVSFFAKAAASDETVGLARVEELNFENNQWVPGRRLNGDEVMLAYDFDRLAATHDTGTGLRFVGSEPTVQRVKLYRFGPAK